MVQDQTIVTISVIAALVILGFLYPAYASQIVIALIGTLAFHGAITQNSQSGNQSQSSSTNSPNSVKTA